MKKDIRRNFNNQRDGINKILFKKKNSKVQIVQIVRVKPTINKIVLESVPKFWNDHKLKAIKFLQNLKKYVEIYINRDFDNVKVMDIAKNTLK